MKRESIYGDVSSRLTGIINKPVLHYNSGDLTVTCRVPELPDGEHKFLRAGIAGGEVQDAPLDSD